MTFKTLFASLSLGLFAISVAPSCVWGMDDDVVSIGNPGITSGTPENQDSHIAGMSTIANTPGMSTIADTPGPSTIANAPGMSTIADTSSF